MNTLDPLFPNNIFGYYALICVILGMLFTLGYGIYLAFIHKGSTDDIMEGLVLCFMFWFLGFLLGALFMVAIPVLLFYLFLSLLTFLIKHIR